MRTASRRVCWLLPFLLTACVHKTHQAKNPALAPPVVDTPPPAPAASPAPSELPPPVVTAPTQSPSTQQASNPPEEKPPVHHPVRHPRPPESKTTEMASASNGAGNSMPNGTTEVSAIGQLTTGDTSDLRDSTERSLASTESSLRSITRSLSDQEQHTAAQVREFVKQARAALATGDVDGAHTLAIKAHVLLAEIDH